jgi:hypothetical protein
MDNVFFGEALHEIVLVLPDALDEVGSYASVE